MKQAGFAEVETKTKILRAAREIFSERGYDGASMAEVAKKAGVNKALPFYYFKSKENLLRELVRNAGESILEWRDAFTKNIDMADKESLEKYYDNALALMESRREMIRIVLVESFKGGGENIPLFDFMEPVVKGVGDHLRSLGDRSLDAAKLMTAELFFDALPLFAFAALGRKWAEKNGFEYKALREDFFDSFRSIYIDYVYKKHFANKK